MTKQVLSLVNGKPEFHNRILEEGASESAVDNRMSTLLNSIVSHMVH